MTRSWRTFASSSGTSVRRNEARGMVDRDAEQWLAASIAHSAAVAALRRCFCLSPAAIDGYNMKKYVWKLLYMYMLGYDIEM